jgi:hypothetical protein
MQILLQFHEAVLCNSFLKSEKFKKILTVCPENGAKYRRADNIGLRPGHYIGSSSLCPGSKQGPVDTSQYLI